MIKIPIGLQDLRRKIYVKAKAEPSWRFWGLYVHVCKLETLQEAYRMARKNNGSPGIDGVTFEAVETLGVAEFLERIRNELISGAYRPLGVRHQEIPKADGKKVRVLSIPTIKDRVVQGALKLILEAVFEADFQPGSYGYRPKRQAHEAIHQITVEIIKGKTIVYDVDLRSFFDNVRHHLLLEKVARRISDPDVMRLLKMTLKATGSKGLPQGGVISPLLSNLYLNEVDRMLEKAREVTQDGRYIRVAYARYADDLTILIDGHWRNEWIVKAIDKRLRQELAKLQVELNEEKSRMADLAKGESFTFLGFRFRRLLSRRGKWWAQCTPELQKRTLLLRRLKEIFRRLRSQPVGRIIELINPILRGWVNYFAIGHSSSHFSYVRDWVEKRIRRHLMRARQRRGFGWKRWSRRWLYDYLGLYGDYRIRRFKPSPKSLPS